MDVRPEYDTWLDAEGEVEVLGGSLVYPASSVLKAVDPETYEEHFSKYLKDVAPTGFWLCHVCDMPLTPAEVLKLKITDVNPCHSQCREER